MAGARPDAHGVPLTRWSLPRLSHHLAGEGIEVSPRHLGTLLAKAGLSFQRTRTWKASPDPDYAEKTARILARSAALTCILARRPPGDGRRTVAPAAALRDVRVDAVHRLARPRQ